MGLGAIDCTLDNKCYGTLFTLATTLATAILYIVETWDLVQLIAHSIKNVVTHCLP